MCLRRPYKYRPIKWKHMSFVSRSIRVWWGHSHHVHLMKCSGIYNPHLHYGKKHYSLMPEKNETQNLPPSWPNDLKTKSSGQDRIKWPSIHTICTIVSVHTQQAQIHKSPLGSLLSPRSTGGLTTMTHMKDVAVPEMFPRMSLEKTAVC